ncbi:hypothetical protein ABUE29_25840, partial [Mesorhizobium sp. ZMM04-4]
VRAILREREVVHGATRRAEQVIKDIRHIAVSLWGRGEDPHRAGWSARRGVDRRAVPPLGDRRKPVLQLVEGVFLEAG